jgi:diguanylate cyclase (GGDEF)-like protein
MTTEVYTKADATIEHEETLEYRVLRDVERSLKEINTHISRQVRYKKDISPLEATLRAASQVLHYTLDIDCSIEIFDQHDQREKVYSFLSDNDAEWGNVISKIIGYGDNYSSRQIKDLESATTSTLHLSKNFERGSYEDEFLKKLLPHVALMTDKAMLFHQAHEDAKLEQEFKFADMLGKYVEKETGLRLLDEYIVRAKEENVDVGVIFADLDSFGKYNNTFGHQQGDEALKIAASVAHDQIRHAPDNNYLRPASLSKHLEKTPKDFGIRFGGEELCYVLWDTDLDEAEEVARRILKAIRVTDIPIHSQNKAPYDTYGTLKLPADSVTASIGVSNLNGDYEKTRDELLGEANRAEGFVKLQGRNGVVVYDSGDETIEELKAGKFSGLRGVYHSLANLALNVYRHFMP